MHLAGVDIPDSESLVTIPLSGAKSQPSTISSTTSADSGGVGSDGIGTAGMLSLFPGGGSVFPIGKKRRFRLDLVSGGETDTDGIVG